MRRIQSICLWLFGSFLILVPESCTAAPTKGCKKSVDSLSQEARLEAQALTDPDEDKVYHANKISDVSFIDKKSMVIRNHKSDDDCDTDTKKKENIIMINVKAAPKSQIVKLNTNEKPEIAKKSSTLESLTNQKVKIQTLQDSIHSNLIKLFHHLKHKHGQLNTEEDKKEVNEAKEALIADAKEMTAMDRHDTSQAENFLKGIDKDSFLQSMLHNKSKEFIDFPAETLSETKTGNKFVDESPSSTKQSKTESVNDELSNSGASSGDTEKDPTGTKTRKNNSKDSPKGNKVKILNSEHISTAKLGRFSVHDKADSSETKVKVKELKEYTKPAADSKHDPYAEIAASPDNVKMPPSTKLPKDDSLMPVGIPKAEDDNDDIKEKDRQPGGGRAVGGSFMPDMPLPGDFGGPSEAPGQGQGQGDLTNAGTVNPDLSNQNILKSMRDEALQAQLQDQIQQQAYEGQLMGLINRASRMKSAFGKDGDMNLMNRIPNGAMGMNGMGGGMRGMNGGMGAMAGGMFGMGGMGGMGGGMAGAMGGMGGIGGEMGGGAGGMAAMGGMGLGGQGGMHGAMNGLDGLGDGSDGVGPAIMGGMGGMRGMNGLGGFGGMGGMRGMNGMGGMGSMGYTRSNSYGMYGPDNSDGYDQDRFDDSDSYRRDGEEPYGDDDYQPGPSMVDEQATGRDNVPDYPRPKLRRLARGYRRTLYNPRYFDDDNQLDEDEDDERGGIPRSRAPDPGRYEDIDEDSDYDEHYFDRKTVIAKVHHQNKKNKVNH